LSIMYIILGCLIDGISMIVLTAVIVLPMVKQAGLDLVWFGVYLVIHVEMAQITPPVGFNLFVLQNMSGRDTFTCVASTRVTLAVCGPSSENSAMLFPFCSSAMVNAVSCALGAAAVTSSVPAWPTKRSGFSMVNCGGAPRPATTYAPVQASAMRTRRARSQRMDSIVQVW